MFWNWGRKRREAQALADAREEALRWYERLGGQVMNLPPGDDPATKQALVDAGERYNAAGGQLERATTLHQYTLARETALEGLAYVRAARIAMQLDPGPALPPLAGQRQAGHLTKEREVDVQGRQFRAGPNPGPQTPYYYPGGQVQGRPVPAGWYSEPWWKTALIAGASTLGTMMIFDALFSPGWGGIGYGGYGGYDAGFEQGLEYADEHGWDPGGNDNDGGNQMVGDGGGYDSSDYSDYSSTDYSGDYGSGDFGGGDWGGGDFGGGDFGGGDFGGDF